MPYKCQYEDMDRCDNCKYEHGSDTCKVCQPNCPLTMNKKYPESRRECKKCSFAPQERECEEEMINHDTQTYIDKAIEQERNAAISQHGMFHNHHEAWAVLREELEELEETFAPFKAVTASEMENLWVMVRSDHIERESILNIYNSSMETAQECIQVLAMCMKWIDLLEHEG